MKKTSPAHNTTKLYKIFIFVFLFGFFLIPQISFAQNSFFEDWFAPPPLDPIEYNITQRQTINVKEGDPCNITDTSSTLTCNGQSNRYKCLYLGSSDKGSVCADTVSFSVPKGQACSNPGAAQGNFCGNNTTNRCSMTQNGLVCADTTLPNTDVKSKQPIKPELQVKIPGLNFTPSSETITGSTRTLALPFIGEYIAAIFKYLIAIAGFIATILIMVSGLQRIMAFGSAKEIGAANDRIKNAFVGLLLALSSYAILRAVNPALVSQNLLRVTSVRNEPDILESEEPDDSIDDPTIGADGAICTSVADCKTKYCDGYKDRADTLETTLKPTDVSLVTLQNAPGLIIDSAGIQATQTIKDGLEKAGLIAKGKTPSLSILVVGGYRAPVRQLRKVCDAIRDPAKINTVGQSIGFPSTKGKGHGAGNAVDINLIIGTDKSQRLVGGISYKLQNSKVLTINSALFTDIMSQAGFQRYSKEVWHFEIGGSQNGCRCTIQNCPHPPLLNLEKGCTANDRSNNGVAAP